MRVLATVVLGAFVGGFACAGQAHVSEQHLCCGSQAAVSEWNPCECCQVAQLEAPAVLPTKAAAFSRPAAPAATLLPADTGNPDLFRHPASGLFARAGDRSPPRLYVLHASLLI